MRNYSRTELVSITAIIAVLAGIYACYSNDEVKCVAGYKFAVGYRLSTGAQILDAQGHGIPCNK